MAIVMPLDIGPRDLPLADMPATSYTQAEARAWAAGLPNGALSSRLAAIASDLTSYHPENRKALIREAARRLR